MSRARLAAGALVLAALASGCGRAPTPAPTPTSSVVVSDPTPTPTPDPTTGCLSGRYQVTTVTTTTTDGRGQGGDLTADFDGGKFTLTGAGQSPVDVEVSGTKAEALIDGTIRGTYTTDAGSADPQTGAYAITGSDGSAKVSSGFIHRTVTMSEIVQLLAPDGKGTLSCTGDQLTMTSSASRLDLRRP